MMSLLFSFVLCRKMREKKIHEKFHKSTLLPDVTVGTSPLVDGHNYAYGTASFPPKGRGNLILIVDGITSIIF